jgi:chromosome partitioning protein
MNVWTIANQKGGVGKTTTAVSLGGLLAERGNRVLLIDMDPHGSLTSYFRFDPDSPPSSGFELFKAASGARRLDPRTLVQQTGVPGLELIPAHLQLASLDRKADGIDGFGLVLRDAVLRLNDDYDQVLIDCPPVLGILLINALGACERLVIPVQTDFLAIKGLERTLHTLRMVNRARHKPLDYTVVPTFFDQRTRASHQSLATLRRDHASHLWYGVVPIDTRLRDASQKGRPIHLVEPRSRSARAYADLCDALLLSPAFEQPATGRSGPAVDQVGNRMADAVA